MPTVHLLDYVAGNVRSLANAIEKLGFDIRWIQTPAEIAQANVRSNEKDHKKKSGPSDRDWRADISSSDSFCQV